MFQQLEFVAAEVFVDLPVDIMSSVSNSDRSVVREVKILSLLSRAGGRCGGVLGLDPAQGRDDDVMEDTSTEDAMDMLDQMDQQAKDPVIDGAPEQP